VCVPQFAFGLLRGFSPRQGGHDRHKKKGGGTTKRRPGGPGLPRAQKDATLTPPHREAAFRRWGDGELSSSCNRGISATLPSPSLPKNAFPPSELLSFSSLREDLSKRGRAIPRCSLNKVFSTYSLWRRSLTAYGTREKKKPIYSFLSLLEENHPLSRP